MTDIHLLRPVSIHIYRSSRKSWENKGPRKYHVLAYQVTGRYDHDFPDGKLLAQPDSMFFIHRKDPYSVKNLECGYCICISFEGDADIPSQLICCREDPRVYSLFQKLLKCQNLQTQSNRYFAMAVLYELMGIFWLRAEQESVSRDPAGRIRLAHAYLLEHFREPGLQASELAGMSGVGTKHFRTLFKKYYGTTPTQYIIDLRLRAASELLAEGVCSVREVSEMTGFTDVYYFSKLFRKRFSIPPGQFKNRARQ